MLASQAIDALGKVTKGCALRQNEGLSAVGEKGGHMWLATSDRLRIGCLETGHVGLRTEN